MAAGQQPTTSLPSGCHACPRRRLVGGRRWFSGGPPVEALLDRRSDGHFRGDFTYVSTWSGFAYTAFVIDVHSRMIVGWRIAATMTADLDTDAVAMAIFSRRTQLLRGVIAHSDAGSQYTSVAHTERLAEIHALASIG